MPLEKSELHPNRRKRHKAHGVIYRQRAEWWDGAAHPNVPRTSTESRTRNTAALNTQFRLSHPTVVLTERVNVGRRESSKDLKMQ